MIGPWKNGGPLICGMLGAIFFEKIRIAISDREAEQKIQAWKAAHPDEKFIRIRDLKK